MIAFSTLLQQGNAWLFIPSAILLGALHGLEPGHSKTMMAAFIVAVRGTIGQAILLGLSAALSHTAVVWVVAMAGLYFGRNWSAQATEPYFQLASAALIIIIACWMLWRTWRSQQDDHHQHEHDETRLIDTGHGLVQLEIFEQGVPPRFRLSLASQGGHVWTADQVRLETARPDGARQQFSFVQRDGFVESLQEIPEPHSFMARLSLGDGHHSHDHEVAWEEQDHGHAPHAGQGLESIDDGCQDAHARPCPWHQAPFCQSRGDDRADRHVWPDGWPDSMSGLNYRSVAVFAVEEACARGYAGAVFQSWPGANHGGIRCAGSAWCSPCLNTLAWLWRIQPQGTVFRQQPDHSGRPVYWLSWLDSLGLNRVAHLPNAVCLHSPRSHKSKWATVAFPI